MHVDSLKKRIARTLTTPPEIAYALGRHWAVLASFVAAGTMLTAAKVATDPVVYEGKATLLVNTKDFVAGGQLRDPREEASRLLLEQKALLVSSTTLRKLVKTLRVDRVLKQSENPEERTYTGVRKYIQKVREKLEDALSWLEHPVTTDSGVEREVQRAIRSFKKRSEVEVNAKDNTIHLQAHGVDRDTLQTELETWIAAYRDRVKEMHEEGQAAFLSSRIEHHKAIERAAWEVLNRFRQDNPQVSPTELETLQLQLAQWRTLSTTLDQRILFLESDVNLPVPVLPPQQGDEDAQDLERRLRLLEGEIDAALAQHPETSRVVQNLRAHKELVEARLAGLTISTSGSLSREDQRKQLEEQKASVDGRLAMLIVQERKLKEKLEELKALEEDYQVARATVKEYERMSVEDVDRIHQVTQLKVRVGDQPEVSTSPANTYPHKQILFGSFGGLALGFLAALALEVLCGKIRFRNDITSEFGLQVVGVIPKR